MVYWQSAEDTPKSTDFWSGYIWGYDSSTYSDHDFTGPDAVHLGTCIPTIEGL